jgi:hypothetical protein
MPGRIADGASLASELERARGDFHSVLTIVGDDEWTKPTEGTRWTNEQLLFHMMFGYMVVQRLLILVRVLSHLPDWVSRWFARVLNAASRPFDAINFYGTNAAAVVYNGCAPWSGVSRAGVSREALRVSTMPERGVGCNVLMGRPLLGSQHAVLVSSSGR